MIHLRGELDLTDVPAFQAAVDRIPQGRPVVLDIRELSFLDCTGLAAILGAQRQLAGGGSLLVLGAPQEQVARLLELTCADQELEIVEEVPDGAERKEEG